MDLSLKRTRELLWRLHDAKSRFRSFSFCPDMAVHMNFALPASRPPKEVLDGIRYVIDEYPEKLNRYIAHDKELLPDETLATFSQDTFKISGSLGKPLGPENIVIGQGAMMLTMEAVRQTVGPRGFLIVPYPTYGALITGMDYLEPQQLILVPTAKNNNFMIQPDQLEAAVYEAKTRSAQQAPQLAFLSIDPHNPTTKMSGLGHKRLLLPILLQEKIHVIDDRVYDGTQHEGSALASWGALSELSDAGQVTTVYSLGKALGGANIKAGFAIGAPETIKGMSIYMGDRFRYVDVTAQSAMARILDSSASFTRKKYQNEMRAKTHFGQTLLRGLIEGELSSDSLERLKSNDGGLLDNMAGENPTLWYRTRKLFSEGIPTLFFENESVSGHTVLLNVSRLYGKRHNNVSLRTDLDVAAAFASGGVLTYPGSAFLYPHTIRVNVSIGLQPLIMGTLKIDQTIRELKGSFFDKI